MRRIGGQNRTNSHVFMFWKQTTSYIQKSKKSWPTALGHIYAACLIFSLRLLNFAVLAFKIFSQNPIKHLLVYQFFVRYSIEILILCHSSIPGKIVLMEFDENKGIHALLRSWLSRLVIYTKSFFIVVTWYHNCLIFLAPPTQHWLCNLFNVFSYGLPIDQVSSGASFIMIQ